MSNETRNAALLLLAKRDYGELAKLIQGHEGSAEQAAATARGRALGEAQANLPGAITTGEGMIRNIDAVIDDPHLGYVTGWGSSHFNPWAWTPGTPWSRDTMARIGQIQGQAFLQAYNTLRGGGQITEAEGRKAQEAIARLADLSQTDEGYLTALHDARREIWELMNLARTRAGQRPLPYRPHPSDTRRGDDFLIERMD